MSALSGKARAIIRNGREGLRPAAGDRERLEALIDAKIATSAAAAGAVTTGTFVANAWRLALGVALAGGSGALAVSLQEDAPAPAASVVVAPRMAVATSAPAPARVIVPAVMSPDALPSASIVKPPRSDAAVNTSRTQTDLLALEVSLLSRATSALRSGRADDALRALDEHKRKFPSGVLSVERRAVRAQALCSLKRVGEGRAELARLSPQSPAAARTKQVCDAAAKVDGS
jgi:hypothetical protein